MSHRASYGPKIALAVLAISTFLSMSVWFSASFVSKDLSAYWGLTATESSLLTIAVQIGFIVGAMGSAATGLADLLPGRRLMGIGAILAAAANLAILGAHGAVLGILLRLLTGLFLALVYPPAVKEVATWFQERRGLALGIMIGSLTLGSALPHLVAVAGGLDWRLVVAWTSVLAATGGAMALSIPKSGPFPFGKSRFNLREALASLGVRKVALADLGYIGHMWELYAMWAWIGAFLASLNAFSPSNSAIAGGLAFGCIAFGTIGCLVGGLISDRMGRAHAALISMISSGCCALSLIFNRYYPVWLVVTICFIWGFWVIADSAQFSAIVTEHAVQEFVGSAVSLQLAAGYAVTILTLWLVPFVASTLSWGVALGILAVGPLLGSLAMRAIITGSVEERPTSHAGTVVHRVSSSTQDDRSNGSP